MKLVCGLLTVTTLSLVGALVQAADRWYTVEVVVFERTSDGGLGSETWPEQATEPRTDLALSPRGDGTVGVLAAGASGVRAIEAVPRGELEFGNTAAKLARSGRYRPLVHLGWRQPGLGPNQALPVRVEGTAAGGGKVHGTVRLYSSRFLHVEAHLVYERAGVQGTYGPVGFELRESRRMRSGDLHYFDHPLFGMLVRAIPYQPLGGEYLPSTETPNDAVPPRNAPAASAPARRTPATGSSLPTPSTSGRSRPGS